MAVVTCTLVADGSSDRVLIPILQWLLDTHCASPTRLNFAQAFPTESGLPASRLRKFDPGARRHRIADLMDSFAPLRELPSFARLEAQVAQVFQA